ncbi:uncharacterized protein LOC129790609 [Lutzomyia longipalpis]|uniref:uncharacterized protein LOC129790609 n=1 Tax=Lutzomyia longipalpis TaxID=7200 RepID=UPI002483E59B|nr:uncharacterized protein LOC129790609 [Lutzomyia longipalpis]
MEEKMFDEKLIREIQKRQSLYDKTNEDYNNYKVKDQAWEDISNLLNAPVMKCKARWKSLRERFVREVKRNRRLGYPEDSTRWNHFKKMHFIKDFICPRNRYPNDNGPQRIPRARQNVTQLSDFMEIMSDSSGGEEHPIEQPSHVEVSPSKSRESRDLEEEEEEDPIGTNGEIFASPSHVAAAAGQREIPIQSPTISAANAGFFLMMDKLFQKIPPENLVDTQMEILNFLHQKMFGKRGKAPKTEDPDYESDE